ncbi:hypothetical protein AB0F42_18205 [Streptomyces buecherae]|uniref:hypothetical protein n=1 Tax=Streptomyces buecherae TaxID=2763006 RepID=UPI0033DFC8F7
MRRGRVAPRPPVRAFGSDIEVVGPLELAAACSTLARRYAAASRCLPDPAAGRTPDRDPAAGTAVRE